MADIKVPKTPTRSFNPNRKPSALLLDQIYHLEWAVRPASKRRNARRRRVRSEAQAAERIAQLTRMVQDSKGSGMSALKLPPMPRAPRRFR